MVSFSDIIMAINHLTGINATNAYKGPLDYPVATSLMGINGIYGPTASKIFAEQTEFDGIPHLTMASSKRYLNEDTLEAVKSHSAETMEKVNTSGFAKWAQENKATIAGMEQILNGVLILVMAKVGTNGSPGNTIQHVDDAAEGLGTPGTANGGTGNRVDITNDVLESSRTGSALKGDAYHAFSDIVDNYAGSATRTNLGNGATLYQLDGSLNGTVGRFEWIIQNGMTTHRMFVPGGTMNGVPIIP